MPLALVLVAGGVRFVRLAEPDRIYFDEVHYAEHAQDLLDEGVERERPAHPPLGKWLIASGISSFGNDPFGWRAAAALAGTSTVLATYRIGQRLFRKRWTPAVAALFLALDGLALTMSRIAMLDIFLGLFVALAFLFAMRDIDSSHRRWRWLAGVALGLAVATKWAGVFVLAAVIAVAVAVEVVRRRHGERTTTVGQVLAVVLPLVLLPMGLYVASYGSWFANVERTETAEERCPEGCDASAIVSGWWFEQRDMWDLQRRLEATHPYRSPPSAWLTLERPVLYALDRCDTGDAPATCDVDPGNRARVLGLGNPALWWPALATYPILTWAAVRRRDWRAGLIVGFVAVQYLPWIASWKPGFLFYMTPVVPFIALALAWLAERMSMHRWLRATPWVLGGLTIVGFAYFYPLWAAVEEPTPSQDTRLWFDSWR